MTVRGRLWAVFVVALVVRLGWVLTLGPDLVWPDEEEFVGIARHLVAGDGYVSVSYRANPILPAYLAGVFAVFGESYPAARAGQAVMGALTCMLVAATGMRVLGIAVGTIAGLMLAVYLPHVYLSGVFYAECMFTLLIASTVYAAVRSLDAARPLPWLVKTGVSFALTTLSRPIFLAYLPFLVAALVYGSRGAVSRRLVMATTLVVATMLGILPWTIRNYLVLGRPVLVSTGFGTKLWQGNNEGAVGDADDRELVPPGRLARARRGAPRARARHGRGPLPRRRAAHRRAPGRERRRLHRDRRGPRPARLGAHPDASGANGRALPPEARNALPAVQQDARHKRAHDQPEPVARDALLRSDPAPRRGWNLVLRRPPSRTLDALRLARLGERGLRRADRVHPLPVAARPLSRRLRRGGPRRALGAPATGSRR